MTLFTKATIGDIRRKAETMPEYQLLWDLLPSHLCDGTILYESNFLYDSEVSCRVSSTINKIVEKYPFLETASFIGEYTDYMQYYYNEIDGLCIDSDVLEGTELQLLERLYYRNNRIIHMEES